MYYLLSRTLLNPYIYVILNRAKDYYENDKERLTVQARDKYKNLSEEENNEKKRIWEE